MSSNFFACSGPKFTNCSINHSLGLPGCSFAWEINSQKGRSGSLSCERRFSTVGGDAVSSAPSDFPNNMRVQLAVGLPPTHYGAQHKAFDKAVRANPDSHGKARALS